MSSVSDFDPFDDPLVDAAADARVRRAFRKGLAVGCLVALAVPAALGLLSFLVLGILMDRGHVPDSAAVPGAELPGPTLRFLREEGLVDEGEQVLYFYSNGFLSLREDGNLFTDRRVISYWEAESALFVEEAGYHEIDGIDFRPDDTLFANSVVSIECSDERKFDLLVSNESGRDVEFAELLRRTWEERRNGAPAVPGEELGAEVLDFLRAEGLVEPDEDVLYFYSRSSGPLRVDGNLFTDRRVISYWDEGDELGVDTAAYADIAGIEPDWGGGPHGVTSIEVQLAGGGSVELWVSPADGGDRAFVQRLEETWKGER